MGSLNSDNNLDGSTIRTIEVAASICVRDGRVFAAQRGGLGELAYRWEFPGGKLEPGESPEQALIREISEELQVDIRIIEPITVVDHAYRTFSIRLYGFLCTLAPEVDFTLSEHVDCRWLSADELESVDWSDADLPFVRWAKGYLHQGG